MSLSDDVVEMPPKSEEVAYQHIHKPQARGTS